MACEGMYNNILRINEEDPDILRNILGVKNYKLFRIITHGFTLKFEEVDKDFHKLIILSDRRLL